MKPLSASQVELYRRCPRKWAFRYTTNLPRPAFTAATSLGTRTHKIAEIYQQTGVVRQEDSEALAIFMPMMPHMPHPKTGMAEHRFDFTFLEIKYMGFMDWRGWLGNGDPTPAVYDYKTSSDPAKYGLKGESDFLTHVQPLIYATSAMLEEKSSEVYMRWIYGKTKGKPKAYKVEAALSWGAVEPQFKAVVHAPAKEIVRLRVLPNLDPNSLAPNRAACHDFGTTCEYAAHCAADETQEESNMGNLLEDLQDLCGDDTPLSIPAAAPAADPINRAKRVSSRPPVTDKGVYLVAVDPAEVKKVITQPPAPVAPKAEVAQPAQQPAPKQPASKPPVSMRSPTAIILEELSTALARAAERIG